MNNDTATETVAAETSKFEQVFDIPEENLAKLDEKLKKINKLAVKLGCAPIETAVQSTRQVAITKNGRPTGAFRTYVQVMVKGETPKLKGWVLTAVITKLEGIEGGEDQVLVAAVPGKVVGPWFRDVSRATVCEHCKVSRRRTETFVVLNEKEGYEQQVGRNCLRDFLGGTDPHDAARYCEFLTELADDLSAGEDYCLGNRGEFKFQPKLALSYVAAAIRVDGWLSRGAARACDKTATADTAWNIMLIDLGLIMVPRGGIKTDYLPTDADRERVERDWAFMEGFLATQDGSNDYLYNLQVSMKAMTTHKTFGILASLLATSAREQGKEIERRKFAEGVKNSKHFGAVKGKVEFEATVLGRRSFEGQYGATTLMTFLTTDGNVAKWFASGDWDTEIGAKVKVKGTVKAHGEYKGVLETTLTRCKFLD